MKQEQRLCWRQWQEELSIEWPLRLVLSERLQRSSAGRHSGARLGGASTAWTVGGSSDMAAAIAKPTFSFTTDTWHKSCTVGGGTPSLGTSKIRTSNEVQKRGRWLSANSARRNAKSARLSSLVAKLPPVVLTNMARAVSKMPKCLPLPRTTTEDLRRPLPT